MGWTDRAKDAANGLLQTEAGQKLEQTIRRKTEEELDVLLGGLGQASGEDAAPETPAKGERP